MIGIICAMKIEADGIVAVMTNVTREKCVGVEFTVGDIGRQKAVVAISGIGKVNAAAVTALMVGKFEADKIVNVGVCGGTCGTGKLIAADSVVQYDFDTTAIGDELAVLDGFDSPYIKCSMDTSKVKADYRGVIASGDRFVAGDEVNRLVELFGAIGFDMESGAVAQICSRSGVEFAVFRVVSDGGDPVEYEKFKRLAAQKGVDALLTLLGEQP